MKQNRGFTVIELLVVIVVLAAATFLVFWQKNNLDITNRDNQRKTAINAMYYSLENAYYPLHGSYPNHINSGVLNTMDPSLFTDPNGIKLGDAGSNYSYTPTDCNGDACTGYTLRAQMEKEADYVKTSKHGQS
ncbi:MAG TPA: prepilin-type N-terminal cleavage/methylation domain-containing protein [Candidatus Saccharimonadaceae bacterium]|nr:prepilin-type N-terminal cleavage/methylation domain-containing protein [Candidatus Saccharimonadaceae bacterium]